MSIVASSCHYSMDVMPQWGIQFQTHSVSQVLPPPRSYYVVSWVPRALPEVVKLIREIPSEEERCLINKHFELGMLVMRRCGVQNPEEIKCLLDGFREGTTRLSSKDSHQSIEEDVSVSNLRQKSCSNSTACVPVIERRKLLIFFNDHRASRPWVLCPAKHCIKSARTTGKVKGRVKIFQYDARSSSVNVSKLFADCLSEFMTQDQYVFATFCPQQKYTDHEIRWFDLSTKSVSGDSGGDVIFKELVEDQDNKGSRVWPFDDYIIFSNSQSKIIAVFKKKQPLLILHRQPWFSQFNALGNYKENSYEYDSFIPSFEAISLNPSIDKNDIAVENIDLSSTKNSKFISRNDIVTKFKNETMCEGFDDYNLKIKEKMARSPLNKNKFNTEENENLCQPRMNESFLNYDNEWSAASNVFNLPDQMCNSSFLYANNFSDERKKDSLLEQAEEAEKVLVRIMSRVLAQLEPTEDGTSLDFTIYNTPVTTTVTSDSKDPNYSFFQRDSPSKASQLNDPDDSSYFSVQAENCKPHNHYSKESTEENWQSTTSTDNSHGNDIVDKLNSCEYDQKYDYQVTRRKQDTEFKKKKCINFQFTNQTILYHDLIRQFLSRLAYGLDHPPSPQKRIPDTVKRVVTKIVSECIQEVNLALLTSSLQYTSDFYISPENNSVSRETLSFQQNICPNSTYENHNENEKGSLKYYVPFENQNVEFSNESAQFSRFDQLNSTNNDVYSHLAVNPYCSSSANNFHAFAQNILSYSSIEHPANSSTTLAPQSQILSNYIQYSNPSNVSESMFEQLKRKDATSSNELVTTGNSNFKNQFTHESASDAKSLVSRSESLKLDFFKQLNENNNAEIAGAEYSTCEDPTMMVPFNSLNEPKQKKRQDIMSNITSDVRKKKKI